MQVGQSYKGFTVLEKTFVKEIQVHVLKLEHEKSGAQMFHMLNDDEENVFSLAFKTYPGGDDGVAHILEHTVLCGSKKYPVRDPFFLMTRRSLNTFMNALTSKIWTAYPAASMNQQDFYNLLDVYLDATLYPLLRKESFSQEASRLEFNENQELVYKGVVFNEMKGSLSSPYSRLFKVNNKALFNGNTYGSDSGGDPGAIVNLTHDELVAFHQKYYHPSRCLYYFYGNIDTKKHIDFLDEKVFCKLDEKKEPLDAIAKIKPFTKPIDISARYPGIAQKDQKQDFLAFSWVMMDIDEQEDLLALTLLDSILMQTDASILKIALLTSGFCQNVDSMLDADTKQIPYMIIAGGCSAKDFEALKSLLFKTLKKISQEGIDQELIDASLTALEIERTEISAGSSPYGLELFYRSILPYMQGASYIKPLEVHSLFETLNKNLKKPNYLQNIIIKYFLENPHFVGLKMPLDDKMQKQEEELEAQNLKKIKKTLSKQDILDINAMAATLKTEQESINPKEKLILPGLTLSAISKQIPYFDLEHKKTPQYDCYFHDCFCNNFVYINIAMPLSNVIYEDLHDLQLFLNFITEVGTEDKSYQKTLIEIQNTFSSLSCSLHLNEQKNHEDSIKPYVVLSSGFMAKNAKKACNLMHSILTQSSFSDAIRLKELILSLHANLQNSMNSQALSLALKESLSSFSSTARLKNHISALPFVEYIDSIVSNLDHHVPRLVEKFHYFMSHIFHFHKTDIVIATQKEHFQSLIKHEFFNLKEIQKHPFTSFNKPNTIQHIPSKVNIIAIPIAHNALSFKTVNSTHKASPALCLASYLIQNSILHKEIREKGGAYGSGAKYSPLSGMFQFYSYRDPNIARTYKMFEHACNLVSENGFSKEELLEAKLGYFSDIETKVPPASRAYSTYSNEMSGFDKEFRISYKKGILDTSASEIIEALKLHILPHFNEAVFISYTNEAMANKANAELDEDNRKLELYAPF